MSTYQQARLPAGPLLDQAAGNASVLARQLDVHRRIVNRWVIDGVPFYAADRAAVRLGVHPASMWPGEWWSAEREQQRLEVDHADRGADAAVRRWIRHRSPRKLAARRELVAQYGVIERHRDRHPTVVTLDTPEPV